MLLRIDLRRKIAAQITRFVPTPARPQIVCPDKGPHQELYESIALGNALADIEEEANRRWRG